MGEKEWAHQDWPSVNQQYMMADYIYKDVLVINEEFPGV